MNKPWWMYDAKNYDHDSLLKEAKTSFDSYIDKMNCFYDDCCDFEQKYQERTFYKEEDNEMGKNEIGKSDVPIRLESGGPSVNIVRMNVETAYNKIAKIKPKATFLTKDKEHQKRQLAEKIDQWILKQFKKGNAWVEGQQAFKDGCIFDLGILKLINKSKQKFCFKKLHPKSFFCSNPFYGDRSPMECGEVHYYSYWDLIDMFSEYKDLIEKKYVNQNKDRSIPVYEAYRVGHCRILCTDKCIIDFRKWKYNFVPYEFMRWTVCTEGVVGYGLTHEVKTLQDRLTEMLGYITETADKVASNKTYVPWGSGVNESDLTNAIGAIVKYKGERPPHSNTPAILHPQYFEHFNSLFSFGMNNPGVNQFSATGSIPSGLRGASGLALRNYYDITTERFQITKQNYEDSFVNMAKKILLMDPPNEFNEFVKGYDVEDILDELQVYPTSLIPEEPVGQFQTLSELMNTGFISQEDAASLINSPDIRKFLKSKASRVDAIHFLIEEGLSNNTPIQVNSYLGIDLQIDIARKKYAELIKERETNNVNSLILLQSYMDALEQRIKSLQEKARLQQEQMNPNQDSVNKQNEEILQMTNEQ